MAMFFELHEDVPESAPLPLTQPLQLELNKLHPNVDLKNYVSNGEWQLLKVTLRDDTSFYAISDEPYPYVQATFT